MVQGNHSSDYQFDNIKYEKVLITKLLPICLQRMLQDEAVVTDKKIDNTMMICSKFLPTITNHGLCLTNNAAHLNEIFKPNDFLTKFEDTFYPVQSQHEVKNIGTDLATHHLTFLVDGNSYKDLKRGTDWTASSNTIFNLGIHSSKDVADIRGWMDRIIKIPSGYITKVSIKQLEIKADDTLRSLDMKHRGCRFTEETDDLTSIKSYSKVNCFFDCKMNEAEKLCGCRPWDYPTSSNNNDSLTTDKIKICDFYGSSCFNNFLQQNKKSDCQKKCTPNCDQISYSISIDKEPIDPEKRICGYFGNPSNVLESEVKKYILSQLMRDEKYGHNAAFIASSPPERRVMSLLKDILLKSNDTYYYGDEKGAYEKDCEAKIKSDVAVVVVSIDSPTFTRMVKSAKVSFFDKLAILGKYFSNYLEVRNTLSYLVD